MLTARASTEGLNLDIRLPIYDPASGRFDIVQLRRALIRRGLDVEKFASRSQCSRSSVYKALRGEGVRTRTAIAILRTMAEIPPLLPLDD